MIGLLQRVTEASVSVDNSTVGRIGPGLVVLVGVEKPDAKVQAERLFKKLVSYRVFADADDKMNLSLSQVKGGLLLVPQFTLPADTKKGLRPSFSNAAPAEQGKTLFDYLVAHASANFDDVQSGVFGANMQVALNNDGPVTFWLQV